MNIGLRKAALLSSLIVAGACTVLYAGASAAQITGKAAKAPDTPFCAFVKKVIAAAPGEFAGLKGEEAELGKKNHDMFKGTLTPGADSECRLHTRRGEHLELKPLYSCQLGPARTLDDAKPVYEKAAAELRAGFPKWKFEEKKEGDESKREESWTLSTEQAGFTVELNLFDWGNLGDLLSGKPSGKPGVLVTLAVTDTAPVPEKPKSAAAQEMTANLPICKFIEKVLAAQANEYAAIRSAKAEESSGSYEGKLRPDAQATCKVFPSKSSNNKHALYSCELRRTKTMAEIKPEYERLKTELQACYSNLKFTENINDSVETHDEIWYLSGKNSQLQIMLNARDDRYLVDSEPEKVDEKTKQAPALLTLSIRVLE